MHVERRLIRVWDEKTKDYINITVQVEVDITAIAEQLGKKAFHNKSLTAKIAHGAVAVVCKK